MTEDEETIKRAKISEDLRRMFPEIEDEALVSNEREEQDENNDSDIFAHIYFVSAIVIFVILILEHFGVIK